MSEIALLHPGDMGGAIGAALVDAGHTVCWLPAGRGSATQRRANAAGLIGRSDLHSCEVVLSICPPAAAIDLAKKCAGYSGIFVDANAISPVTASAVAEVVRASGAVYVDGGIIGPPPTRAGTTRIFLSGERAIEVAEIFRLSRVEAVVLSGDLAASALKMTYAAWTKITSALLIGVRQTAVELGVEEALIAEWSRSQPGLADRLSAASQTAAAKGWRWEDEMRQIAETFFAAGQPPGFGEAAASIFMNYPRPVDS